MNKDTNNQNTTDLNRVKLYDGYKGDPIFAREKNNSAYSYITDKQCVVPIRSREKIWSELDPSIK